MKVICFFQCVDICTDGSETVVGKTGAALIWQWHQIVLLVIVVVTSHIHAKRKRR